MLLNHTAAASHSGSFIMEENMQLIYTVEFSRFNDVASESKTATQTAEKNKQDSTQLMNLWVLNDQWHKARLQTSHTSLHSSARQWSRPSLCCYRCETCSWAGRCPPWAVSTAQCCCSWLLFPSHLENGQGACITLVVTGLAVLGCTAATQSDLGVGLFSAS